MKVYNLEFSTVVSNDFKPTFQSKTVKLNSGYEIPVLGLGTWLHKYDFENQMGDAVVYAIKKGYRVSQFSPDDGWVEDRPRTTCRRISLKLTSAY